MSEDIPNSVKIFLYPMFGVIKDNCINFLNPKKVQQLKKDPASLIRHCEAIIWILTHKNSDYSNWVAKCYDNKDVIDFTASNAIVFLYEDIFKQSGLKFDENLLPEDIDKIRILKFYKDYPPEVNIFRYLYRGYVRSIDKDVYFLELQNRLQGDFEKDIHHLIEAINSISHFDADDYAIALQDFDNPERAKKFIRMLEQALKNIISKNSFENL